MDREASKLCGSDFSKPAKSSKVGLLCSVFGKAPFGRVAAFTFLLLLRVTSCSGINLQDAAQKIQAIAGERVILPCNISVKGELPTVEWSKEGLDPNITFLYRDGCETFDMKNKAFRYRTNLIMDELKDGNISLMISAVQLTDAGKHQCVVVRGRQGRDVVKTLELVVGAFSEPKLSVVPDADGALILECEASCWFPEPEVTFLNEHGNITSAENPRRRQDPRGCFNVTRRVTVPSGSNRVMCRVHEPQMNKTSVKEIPFIRGDCVYSCILPFSILSVILGCACLFICTKYASTETCSQTFKRMAAPMDEVVHQGNQAVNDLAGLQGRVEELQNLLSQRDEKIRQLTAQVTQQSRQRPVLQQDQPTIMASPSTSSPDTSKPVSQPLDERPQVSSAAPPASAHSSHSTQEEGARKDSKPAVLRQKTPVDPQVKSSSSSKSSPALFINDGADSSASSSSSYSDNKVHRTRSQSNPPRNAARPPRRHTFSDPPSYLSYNPFSPLENLSEESEKLLPRENIRPSILYRLVPVGVAGGAGAYPSYLRARGGVHPGQVAGPSQGHT